MNTIKMSEQDYDRLIRNTPTSGYLGLKVTVLNKHGDIIDDMDLTQGSYIYVENYYGYQLMLVTADNKLCLVEKESE